ncbi:unnamed protein product, partial [Discosporangium mesarthrocarpum]
GGSPAVFDRLLAAGVEQEALKASLKEKRLKEEGEKFRYQPRVNTREREEEGNRKPFLERNSEEVAYRRERELQLQRERIQREMLGCTHSLNLELKLKAKRVRSGTVASSATAASLAPKGSRVGSGAVGMEAEAGAGAGGGPGKTLKNVKRKSCPGQGVDGKELASRLQKLVIESKGMPAVGHMRNKGVEDALEEGVSAEEAWGEGQVVKQEIVLQVEGREAEGVEEVQGEESATLAVETEDRVGDRKEATVVGRPQE